MGRVNIFAKGNLDVRNSLHSFRVAERVEWNGLNELMRQQQPGVTIRLRHETFTRSDALCEAAGTPPDSLFASEPPLGAYTLASQFSLAVFEVPADAIVLSIQPDIATGLVRHRRSGALLYPYRVDAWPDLERKSLSQDWERIAPLDPEDSLRNFWQIIERLKRRSEAPILIYNVSPAAPGETTRNLFGLGETFSTRVSRFNLALRRLSEKTGVTIVDVESIVARAGADRVKLDAFHLTVEGYRLVAQEVLDILAELGVFST